MKKLFFIIVFLMALSGLNAAYQYSREYAYQDYISLVGSYGNVNILFKENSGLSLIFSNDIKITDLFNTMTIEAYKTNGTVELKQLAITNEKIDFGTYEQDTLIKIVGLTGNYSSTVVNFGDRGMWDATYGYNTQFALEGHYDIYNNPNQYFQYNFRISDDSDNIPNGQPLPGVLATLIVGGIGVGIAKFRKK